MIKKIIFKAIGNGMKVYWRIFKPFTIGVRAIIINDKKEILLIKHTYNESWFLPGGGVNKNEHLLDALNRELYEELSLTINGTPVLLGTFSNFHEFKSDFVTIFIVKSFDMSATKNFEIEDWNFFSIDKIPQKTSPGTKKRLNEYLGIKSIDYKW